MRNMTLSLSMLPGMAKILISVLSPHEHYPAFLQFPMSSCVSNSRTYNLVEGVALIYERGLFVLDNLYTSPCLCRTLSGLTPWLR